MKGDVYNRKKVIVNNLFFSVTEDCPDGSYIDKAANYKNCTACPNGEYQNLVRQTECKKCPVDHDTQGKTGSLSNKACVCMYTHLKIIYQD